MTRNSINFVLAGIIGTSLVGLGACGSVGVVRMSSARVASKPSSCTLQLFGSEQDIKVPFEVLCLIDAKTGGSVFERHSVEAAVDKLRPAACGCGADALLVIDANKEGAMSSFSAGWGRGMVKVKAIRLLPASSAPAATSK